MTRRETRVELARLAFFAILLAYLVLLLTDLPRGLSGLFPVIVITLVAALVGYRLLTILVGMTGRDLPAATGGLLDRVGLDVASIGSTDAFLERADDGAPDGAGTSTAGMAVLLGWTLAGFAFVYVLGIVVGSLLYITSFLYLQGDHGVEVSVIVAFLVTGLMLVVIFAFSLPLWEGVILAG